MAKYLWNRSLAISHARVSVAAPPWQRMGVVMDVLFSGVAVREFDISRDWYGRLFGRPADVVVHDHEVMWRVTDGGWLYIVKDLDRAGRSLVALSVAGLDALVADLTERNLKPGPIEPEGDAGRKSKLEDPDGNLVALIEVVHDRGPLLRRRG